MLFSNFVLAHPAEMYGLKNFMNSLAVSVFEDFERLVDQFTGKTGVFFPKLSCGRNAFFSGFSAWMNQPRKVANFAMITPDPIQGLALPNARQVISSQLSSAAGDISDERICEFLARYGLAAELLSQPVSTLSGGELLLLTYAKADAQAGRVSGLFACNPLFWLNSSRHHYWNELCECYKVAGKPVEVMVLAGDENFASDDTHFDFSLSSLSLKIDIRDLRVTFPEIQFPVFHPEKQLYYQNNLPESVIASPFLITGDNGVGKSLLAKVLAGVMPVSRGCARATSHNGSSVARLLFQESITQLFARLPLEYLADTFSGSRELYKVALEIFAIIFEYCTDADDLNTSDNSSHSLLAVKTALIAARLAEKPALLLLDEPAWGLSRLHSCRLVYQCCKIAHAQDTAVGIVSHQPAWHSFAACNIHLKKIDGQTVRIDLHEKY